MVPRRTFCNPLIAFIHSVFCPKVTPGDGGFSSELEATTRAVAPAFPRITFVKVCGTNPLSAVISDGTYKVGIWYSGRIDNYFLQTNE